MMSMQLTLHEAMDMLRVSRSTLDRWRKHKGLPYRKIGKEILIEKAELELWIHKHSSAIQHQQEALAASRFETEAPAATIGIGYQSRSAQVWTSLIMKELGWFEEELATMLGKQKVNVRWIDAANGPELLQRMIGGDIHIASLGDYPIALSFSLRRLLPMFKPALLAFDGKSAAGEGISLVVRNDIQISHASELADLPISAAAQSASGGRLPRLLRSLGIEQETSVFHQELDDSMEGIMNRRIAGSVLAEPYISMIKRDGTGRVLFQEGLQEDFITGIIADEQWAERNHTATIAYLKAHLRVHHYIRTNPVRAAQLIAGLRGLPVEIAAEVICRIRWDAALYEKDLTTIQRFQPDIDGQSGSLNTKGSNVRYRSEFLQQAMEELKLPATGLHPLSGEWTKYQLY
jgi:NitT/TauT family transport system substrate-binding protein